jgi:hypothetical protein
VNLNESKRKGDYEIVLNADTTVKLSTEDVDLLSVKFNSATIKELDSKTLGNTVGQYFFFFFFFFCFFF